MTTPVSANDRDQATGPGTRLAQAREDSKLGLEEVAHRLHLSTRQIEALEQDDYRSLPGATYVRGYLKSYALLLGIDPGPVLDAHSRMTAKPSPPPDFSNITPQREITSRHHQVRIVTYLVAVVVIGLAIAWWQGRNTPTSSPLAVNQTAEPATAAPVIESTDVAATAVPSPVVSEEGQSSPAPTSVPPGQAPVATVKPEALAVPLVQPPAAPVPAPAPAKPVAAPMATQQPVSPPAAQPVPMPAGPRGKVVVYADQDTWVDVRDGRQVKLLYETVTAGRSVTLEGVEPISIFLGNAAGARVEFNGRSVDIARYQRGMVARFVLGGDNSTPSSQR